MEKIFSFKINAVFENYKEVINQLKKICKKENINILNERIIKNLDDCTVVYQFRTFCNSKSINNILQYRNNDLKNKGIIFEKYLELNYV